MFVNQLRVKLQLHTTKQAQVPPELIEKYKLLCIATR